MEVIINDPGGNVIDHVMLGLNYYCTGVNLIVEYCASACLDILKIVPKDHICFRPDAWIGYHSHPGIEDTTTMIWERGRDWIARGYKQCG